VNETEQIEEWLSAIGSTTSSMSGELELKDLR
jgi:hypothetical protein